MSVNSTAEAKSKRPVEPVSVSPKTASLMLDLHYETVRDLITREVFTVLAPKGRGLAKRIYLHTDEVKRYGETRSEDAVRELRIQKGRLKPRRK